MVTSMMMMMMMMAATQKSTLQSCKSPGSCHHNVLSRNKLVISVVVWALCVRDGSILHSSFKFPFKERSRWSRYDVSLQR